MIDRILKELVEADRPLSRQEMGASVHYTRRMVKEELIEEVSSRPQQDGMGNIIRGRPVKLYSITEKGREQHNG